MNYEVQYLKDNPNRDEDYVPWAQFVHWMQAKVYADKLKKDHHGSKVRLIGLEGLEVVYEA